MEARSVTVWDPFGIIAKHQEIKQRIEADEPGYAQTDIARQIVSYVNQEHPGYFIYGFRPQTAAGVAYSHFDLFEEFLLDLADGAVGAIASPKTFSRARVKFIIKDKRAYPKSWVKVHAEADELEKLLKMQPELFI
jgi:hypothetical protein